MAVSVGTLPFGRSVASAEQRRYCTEVAPMPSFSIPLVMKHPKGSTGKDVCGCPLPPSGSEKEGGERRGKALHPHAFLFLPAADGELPPAFPLEVYRKGFMLRSKRRNRRVKEQDKCGMTEDKGASSWADQSGITERPQVDQFPEHGSSTPMFPQLERRVYPAAVQLPYNCLPREGEKGDGSKLM
ncbi:unnamed protein product [Coccothraustes coccothraustes]